MTQVLSNRALNRALLARQLLLRRAKLDVADAVSHLLGLQAQAPNPPYFALWSRLSGYRPEVLAAGLTERRFVRGTAWRGTVHLLTAQDYFTARAMVDPLLRGILPASEAGKAIAGVDYDELVAAAVAVLRETPLTNRRLDAELAERWPGHRPGALGSAVQHLLPLLQLPPRGVWGRSGQPTLCLPAEWLGRDMPAEPDAAAMVRRYLAAFGPATVADMQAFTGVRGLREVFAGLREQLSTFHNEQGRELFDLPEAPRPDPDTPAPPRFTAEFDNLLLAHADRTRVISDEHRKRLFPVNGVIPGAILVNGFVRGAWRLRRDARQTELAIEAYEPLRKKDTEALHSQGMRMLAFCAKDADRHQVSFR